MIDHDEQLVKPARTRINLSHLEPSKMDIKRKMMRTEFAFPVLELNHTTGNICAQHFGMTIRDYFAAKAMQGFLASSTMFDQCDAVIAKYAYRMADAMIVESGREK